VQRVDQSRPGRACGAGGGRKAVAAVAITAGALLGAAGRAEAQPSCASAVGANALYVVGPSNVEGSLAPETLVRLLVSALGFSQTVVYSPAFSCTAIQDLMTRTAGSAQALYLDPTQPPQPCLASSVAPDIAVSDVYADTCVQNLMTPTGAMFKAGMMAQRDFLGPVAVTTLVTPVSSSETVISAEAAYVVFGFAGAGSVVSPWSVPHLIVTPKVESGLLNLVSTAIGLGPTKWGNVAQVTTTATSSTVNAVSTAATPSAAIGLLPSPVAESLPDTLRVLAYQDTHQSCGYLPNSDADHLDKINVRQGRYALWGPIHVIMAVDVLGNVVDHTGSANPLLTRIAKWLEATGPNATLSELDASASGDSEAGAIDSSTDASDASGDASVADVGPSVADEQALARAEATAGLIPWCAMQVTRTEEMGAEASYQPPEPCGCYYESLLGGTLSTCMPCRVDGDCNAGAPRCRYGYCEVQ
jgi:hypothetical protein